MTVYSLHPTETYVAWKAAPERHTSLIKQITLCIRQLNQNKKLLVSLQSASVKQGED